MGLSNRGRSKTTSPNSSSRLKSISPLGRKRSKSINNLNGAAGGNNNVNNINLWKLLLAELNVTSLYSGNKDDKVPIVNNDSANASMQQVVNAIKIPIYLESVMLYGLLYCLNSFLTLFIIMPIRLTINTVLIGRAFFTAKRGTSLNFRFCQKDYIYFVLLVCSLLIIRNLDTSKIYHNIRIGTAIKLYVMVGVLEVLDKLLSSIGQEILNILFNINLYRYRDYMKFIIFLVASLIYLSFHSYIFVYQIMSLNVAINSYSNALLTLILSAQFSEIKSSVFKKFDREGLFQITLADLTERFHLFVILFVILLRNLNTSTSNNGVGSGNDSGVYLKPKAWYSNLTYSLYLNYWIGIIVGPTFIVIGSEILVDWLKHLYITKFNKIKPSIYEKFLKILAMDYINTYKKLSSTHNNEDETAHMFINDNNIDEILLCKRIGLPLLTMVIVFYKMSVIPILSTTIITTSTDNSGKYDISVFGIILTIVCFVLLLFIRLILSLILLKWSNATIKRSHAQQQQAYKSAVIGNNNNPNNSSAVLPQHFMFNDFVPGEPNTSACGDLSPTERKNLYDVNETVPLSQEEFRNKSILRNYNKRRHEQHKKQAKDKLKSFSIEFENEDGDSKGNEGKGDKDSSPTKPSSSRGNLGSNGGFVDEDKFDELNSVMRYEMNSKRIW